MTTLRERIASGPMLMAPGAYDGLTAKLIAGAGFEAVYMTGYGVAATWGYPDIGLLTMTDMVHAARRIAAAVDVPVLADADTGYGDANNVARTVREYEAAGVAAIQLEDQTWPKRCGHMEGKSLIPASEMAEKIAAAVDARTNRDTLIIARTDAIAVDGFDAALERGALFADAGADILFIEAPRNKKELVAIPEALPQRPHFVNLAPKTPSCTRAELEAMGYALAIYPGISLVAAWTGVESALRDLKDTGDQANLSEWTARFSEMHAFLGVSMKD